MRHCVDFEANPSDWISRSGSFEVMPDTSFTCSRGWVVIQSPEFAQLEPTDANPLIPALTTLFAAVMSGAAVIWGAKRVYRLLMSGGGRDE